MNTKNLFTLLLDNTDAASELWKGQYKIPWDEPGFSKRMLKEHLSQDHDLASRRFELIDTQVEWIHNLYGEGKPLNVLDVGCGPGFYIKRLLNMGHSCTGIDFSPASIEYARQQCGEKGIFIHGDVRTADFGSGYNMALMVYGECNVFSPVEINHILRNIYEALQPGGTLLVEPHTYEAVKTIGKATPSWYAAPSGLFSESPHICLIRNQWFEEQHTSQQQFVVLEEKSEEAKIYRSTTKAWADDELTALLEEAGFKNVTKQTGWSSQSDALFLISAVKPVEE